MATHYDKIIRFPLKREPAGVAACPDEDRCQLEVVVPDKTQALEIITAEDGSKLVRVGMIKQGGGCDYKVRVGMVADREGDFLLIRMGNYQSGYYATVFDVAANRTLDPTTLPVDANSPPVISLPAVAAASTLWTWLNYYFERATAADTNVSGGLTQHTDGTANTGVYTLLSLDEPSSDTDDPRHYYYEAQYASAETGAVYQHNVLDWTMSGLLYPSGTWFRNFANSNELYTTDRSNPPNIAAGDYKGYIVYDADRPGTEHQVALSLSSAVVITNSSANTIGTFADEVSEQVTCLQNVTTYPAGTVLPLSQQQYNCSASRNNGDWTISGECLGGALGGGGNNGGVSSDYYFSVWPQKDVVGQFGYYSLAGFYAAQDVAETPASISVTGGGGDNMGAYFAADAVDRYDLILPILATVVLYDDVPEGYITDNKLSMFDALSLSNTSKATGLAACVRELAEHIRDSSYAFSFGVSPGPSYLFAYTKKATPGS